jgi:hypothetical protein
VDEQLEAILEKLAPLDRELEAIQKETEPIRDALRLLDAKLILEIEEERDAQGKRRYTNERARRAALIVRQADSSERRQLIERLKPFREKRDAVEHQRGDLIMRYMALTGGTSGGNRLAWPVRRPWWPS